MPASCGAALGTFLAIGWVVLVAGADAACGLGGSLLEQPAVSAGALTSNASASTEDLARPTRQPACGRWSFTAVYPFTGSQRAQDRAATALATECTLATVLNEPGRASGRVRYELEAQYP